MNNVCTLLDKGVSAVLEDFLSFLANSRRAMPLVVPDQKGTFETSDFFKKLRDDCKVIYVGSKDRQSSDSLLEDCKNQELHINFDGRGTTLTLPFKNSVTGKGHGLSSDFVEVDHEEKMIRMVKPLILNGVCVIFKGWLGIETLVGIGHLEFDPEAAKEQERLLYNPSSGPDVTYLSETPDTSLMAPLSVYQMNLLSFPPIPHGVTIPALLSQHPQPDIPFLTPSASPSESMEMPFQIHWKKRNRRYSESSRESQRPLAFLAAPSPNVSSENEVLDLSKSSKTYPPKMSSSSPSSSSLSSASFEYRGRVASLDETVNSFNNCCNIHNNRDTQRGTLRLTPKKKYSSWDFRKPVDNSATASERLKDSSTQTSRYDFSFLVEDSPGIMFSSSTPVHGNNPGAVGVIKEEMLENKENNCKRSLPPDEKN